MTAYQLIGMIFLCVAALDLVLAFVILRPRIQEDRRKVVLGAIGAMSLVLVVIGVVFLTGLVGGS